MGVLLPFGLIAGGSCGGDVATSGCPDQMKDCLVAGQHTCVRKDDPKYGCASETTCLSCGPFSAINVKPASCDITLGTCAPTTCRDGYKHCPSGPVSAVGCETVIQSDVNNCGDCGKVCPQSVANGKGACVAGTCQPACNTGFADCDEQIENGCECDLSTHQCSGTSCIAGP
jgi:hypothetical protein